MIFRIGVLVKLSFSGVVIKLSFSGVVVKLSFSNVAVLLDIIAVIESVEQAAVIDIEEGSIISPMDGIRIKPSVATPMAILFDINPLEAAWVGMAILCPLNR